MPKLNTLGKTTLATIIVAVALVAVALVTLIPLPHGIAAAATTSSQYFAIIFQNVPPVLINNSQTSSSITVTVKPSSSLSSVASSYFTDIAVLFGSQPATIKQVGPQEFLACYKISSSKKVCLKFEIQGATFYTTTTGTYIESPQLGITTILSFNIVLLYANATKDYEPIYIEVYAHPASTTYSTTNPYTTLNVTGILVLQPSYYEYKVASFTITGTKMKNGYIDYKIENIQPAIENQEKTNLYAAMSKVCIYYKNGVPTSSFPYTDVSGMTAVACAFKEVNGKVVWGPYMVKSVEITVLVYAGSTLLGEKTFKYNITVVQTSSGAYALEAIPSQYYLEINTTKLTTTQLEALEKHPNVTIVYKFSGPYGIAYDTSYGATKFISVFAFKPPVAKGVSVGYTTSSGKSMVVKEVNGIFYLPGSVTSVNVNITVQAYALMYKTNSKYKAECVVSKSGSLSCKSSTAASQVVLPTTYPYVATSSSVPSLFKIVAVYVNGTKLTQTLTPTIVNMTESDLTGLQNYTVKISGLDVSKVKYKTNITIVLAEASSYGREFKITFFIAKELTAPSTPTFKLIKEGTFVVGITDLQAQDKVGISAYKLVLPSYNVTISVKNLTASYYILYYGEGENKYASINYTKCLVEPDSKCVTALQDLAKYGGLLVGYGNIYIVPPKTSPTMTVKVYAINYGGLLSKTPATVTVNYGTDRYDAYFILYLVKGWNIFAIPGALPTGWGSAFATVMKNLYTSGVVTQLWCSSPGPLISVEECTLEMLKNPAPYKSGILSPYVFFVYSSSSKPEVYVIPVKFIVLKPTPSPLQVILTMKPEVWNAIPVALTFGGELKNVVTLTPEMYGVPVMLMVYRPLNPSLIITVGRCFATSSGLSCQPNGYILPGEVLIATSTVPVVVQIVSS
ncbi:MAG: hypothetical protein GXO26_00885 [Crenarchaeota archaeon]|nr:hypothetical protein [Thermoproteota archaeon]